jgi:DNA-binding NarL/FixJ family response regulator
VVIAGSIWAPRRLLSKLIDRLLAFPDTSLASVTPQLTDRERQVLDLILMARSNREIARQLGIKERTVKTYVGSLMRKTGVDNRIELSMRALNLSLASQPSDSGLSEPGAQRQSSS